MTRIYAWWSGLSRQGRTGWTLVIVGICYVVYFLKARLFEAGAPITNREWFYFGAMVVLIVLGTVNIRMAEMRERRQKTLPLVDPNRLTRR